MQTENKMGILPIKKLLFSMSIPMAISMLVQALYNVVDSIYVAQINEQALTAISLAYPIQNLMISIVVGTAVGVNALLSRSLGSKNFRDANKAANNALLITFAEMLLFMLFGFFGTEAFFRSQTTDPQIIEYGVQYLTICSVVSFGFSFEIMLERLINSTGKTIFTMVTQATGAVINIILDPILIFGYFGLPAMGIRGAAVATVIGQIVAMLMSLVFNLAKNHEIKLRFRDMSPDWGIIKTIFAVGVPSIVMMSITSVMTYLLNKILIVFSTTATAVLGVYLKLQSFVFMPIFGMNNGMVPIIAYNHGAKKGHRILETAKLSIITAVIIMLVGLAALQIIPDVFLRWFQASDNMLGIGVPALRIISLSYVFAGFCVVAGSIFQALGRGSYCMYVSIARQLVILVPAAYLLSLSGVLNNVWLSFPIAELCSMTLSVFFMVKIYREKILPILPEGDGLFKKKPSVPAAE